MKVWIRFDVDDEDWFEQNDTARTETDGNVSVQDMLEFALQGIFPHLTNFECHVT